jgi:DNA processing protein
MIAMDFTHQISEFSLSETVDLLTERDCLTFDQAFYLGNLTLLKRGVRVAVVGCRKPTPQGISRTQTLTKKLVERDITVVSGLAAGIDAAAHETALLHGGSTIAVTGTPLDQPYPLVNAHLFQRLANEQLVISQFPVGSKFNPKNFLRRNETTVLISHATIIVEAGETSGLIYLGWRALRMGRLLFLLESLLNNTTLSWPKKMAGYGAKVLTNANFDEQFRALTN